MSSEEKKEKSESGLTASSPPHGRPASNSALAAPHSSSGWRLTPSGRVVQSSRHRHAPSHDYVVVITEDGHYLSSHGSGASGIASLDHDALMSVLRRLLDKLARVHAAGYEAGNATLEHVLVERKNHEPMLDTFSHLSPAGNAVGEVPTLLASFYKLGTLDRNDIRALISHYLDSEPGRRAQAEEFLRPHPAHGPHSSGAAHSASGPHHVQHHVPPAHLQLEDRLLAKFDKRYKMFFAP